MRARVPTVEDLMGKKNAALDNIRKDIRVVATSIQDVAFFMQEEETLQELTEWHTKFVEINQETYRSPERAAGYLTSPKVEGRISDFGKWLANDFFRSKYEEMKLNLMDRFLAEVQKETTKGVNLDDYSAFAAEYDEVSTVSNVYSTLRADISDNSDQMVAIPTKICDLIDPFLSLYDLLANYRTLVQKMPKFKDEITSLDQKIQELIDKQKKDKQEKDKQEKERQEKERQEEARKKEDERRRRLEPEVDPKVQYYKTMFEKSLKTIETLNGEKRKLQEEIRRLQYSKHKEEEDEERIFQLEQEIEQCNREYEELLALYDIVCRKIEILTNALNYVKAELGNMKPILNKMKEDFLVELGNMKDWIGMVMKNFKSRIEEKDRQLNEKDKRIQDLEDDLSSESVRRLKAEEERREFEKKIKEMEEQEKRTFEFVKVFTESLMKELTSCEQQVNEMCTTAEGGIYTLRGELNATHTTLEENKNNITSLTDQQEQDEAELSKQKAELEKVQRQHDFSKGDKNKYKELVHSVAVIAERLQERTESLSKLTEKKRELEREHISKSSELRKQVEIYNLQLSERNRQCESLQHNVEELNKLLGDRKIIMEQKTTKYTNCIREMRGRLSQLKQRVSELELEK